jgi:ATP-dependent Lon protease
MMMPFVIGRPSSTRAFEHALLKDKRIFLAAQHDASVDDPRPEDIYTMGCVANVVQSLKLPDGNIKVLVEGVDRARAVEWKEDKGFYRVVVKVLSKQRETSADAEQTMSRVVSLFEQYVKLSNNLHYDAMIAAVRVDDPGKLADTIAAHLLVGVDEKQHLLETVGPIERLDRIAGILAREVDNAKREHRIESRVRKHIRGIQREYRESVRKQIIQTEIDDFTLRVKNEGTSEEERAKIREELTHLAAMAAIVPSRRRASRRRKREGREGLLREALGLRAEARTEKQTTEPKPPVEQPISSSAEPSAAQSRIARSGFWGGVLGGFIGSLLLGGLEWLLRGR